MTHPKTKMYWVVALVESGVPVMAQLYADENSARKQEQFLRQNMNPEDDETGVFEVSFSDSVFDNSDV